MVREGKLVGIVTRANLVQALATLPAAKPVGADDHAIGERFTKELATQPWGLFVNALVQDGVIHLWGYIDSEQERHALRILAENTPGATSVEDHLVRRPTSGTGE